MSWVRTRHVTTHAQSALARVSKRSLMLPIWPRITHRANKTPMIITIVRGFTRRSSIGASTATSVAALTPCCSSSRSFFSWRSAARVPRVSAGFVSSGSAAASVASPMPCRAPAIARSAPTQSADDTRRFATSRSSRCSGAEIDANEKSTMVGWPSMTVTWSRSRAPWATRRSRRRATSRQSNPSAESGSVRSENDRPSGALVTTNAADGPATPAATSAGTWTAASSATIWQSASCSTC